MRTLRPDASVLEGRAQRRAAEVHALLVAAHRQPAFERSLVGRSSQRDYAGFARRHRQYRRKAIRRDIYIGAAFDLFAAGDAPKTHKQIDALSGAPVAPPLAPEQPFAPPGSRQFPPDVALTRR